MWIFDKIFGKKSYTQDTNDAYDDLNSYSIFGISNHVPINVQPRQAYYLSERNNDLGNAIQSISNSISGLKLGLRESDDAELNFTHPLVQLLNDPNPNLRGQQFMAEAAESFLLTQEMWTIAIGNINRPPQQLKFIRPYDINVTMDESVGFPSSITTTSNKDRRTYSRQEIKGRIRYIDKTGLQELIPIIGSVSLTDEWRGRSPLIKLYYDILMNTDGKRHNVSLLKNGMRVSSIISPSGTNDANNLTEDQVKALQNQMRAFNQGAGNAGNNMISSKPLKVEGLNQSNKEMDYISLLQNSQIAIYNLYKIPLPLVLPETMTYSNYTSSTRIYYTKAVFPVFDQLADGLIHSLWFRYKDLSGQETLSFSDIAIRDMQPVLVENMRELKEAEANSINEIRSIGGFEKDPNGDDILVSSNKVPLSFVSEPLTFNDSSLDKDVSDDSSETDSESDEGQTEE